MKEFMNQHGETVLAGTAAALVISSFAGMVLEQFIKIRSWIHGKPFWQGRKWKQS